MGVKDQFPRFTKPNYYSRIDNNHILEIHIGLDDKGHQSVELRHNNKQHKLKGTDAIEINQYSRPDYNTLRFSLADDEVSSLFYMFCDDMIDHTRELKDKSDGYISVVNRYHLWKKMFLSNKNSFLPESEIMGLIGELLYLSGPLAERIGLHDALFSWSGQELTHKDFSFEDHWVEVKTISGGKTSVKISSMEQLASDNDGELAVFSLEKMSENYSGITLNNLAIRIKNSFTDISDENKFMAQLAMNGYVLNDYYDHFVYEQSDFRHYKVTKGFPRLTPDDMPEAITKVSYEISLTELSEYEIK